MTDFWHLINPKLDDTLPVKTVIDFIEELMFISVDIILYYLQHCASSQDPLEMGITSRSQQAVHHKSPEAKQDEMNRQCAIRYLLEARRNKQNILENIKDMLKFNTVVRR